MKISLNWLKEYIDLSGLTTSEITEALTMAGLEVDEVTDQNQLFQNFVIGYVKERIDHPKSDHLSLCTVSVGESDLQIVCGAPNVAAGQTVPVAVEGAVVPASGLKIAKVKLRGVESFGMICSEAELGISQDHSGIMVLPAELTPGQPVTEALQLNDVLFEISITPNRPDALSHLGVARDLAAIFNRKIIMPDVTYPEGKESVHDHAKVEIIDQKNCPRYSALVVKGVTVQESPEWMKSRLRAVGLRPINNIVDITNYVLMECGQPLHAFDLDMLADQKIIVRTASEGEKFVTLDSQERKLHKDTLMICDGMKPVAVAGVMGGENSEVTTETKNILIESAYFHPSSVRKTSKRLGLSTDASYRFERGTDYGNTLFAAKRAAKLMRQIAGGNVCAGCIDQDYISGIETKVKVRFERIRKVLGYEVPAERVIGILSALGCKPDESNDEYVRVTVPTFRPDIEREIDLIEEVARIYGYDNIPAITTISVPVQESYDTTAFSGSLRTLATSVGLHEIISNSLIAEKYAAVEGVPVIKLLNPLSSDLEVLRPSLLTGAMNTLQKNLNVGEKDVAIFELGRIFQSKTGALGTFDDILEEEHFSILVSGNMKGKDWFGTERKADLFDLKGLLSAVLSKKSLDNELQHSYNQEGNSIFDVRCDLSYGSVIVGSFGQVRKEILALFDIGQPVFYAELSVDQLRAIPVKPKKYRELLRYPKVYRDFAFIVDEELPFGTLAAFIKKEAAPILQQIELFDVYRHASVGAGKKSLAIALEYYHETRTLTEEEVEKDFTNLIAKISRQYNAVLRGK